MLRTCARFIWLSLALLLVVGCGSKQATPPPVSGAVGLQELAEVYKYLEYSKEPPPTRVEDLSQYIDTVPNALPRLQNGDYEVIWGVGLSSVPPSSGGVLAFERKTSTAGGAVLLRDGSVREMTPQEFAAALKIQ